MIPGIVASAVRATPAAGAYRDEVLADNPTRYWRLSDGDGATTAVDETGQGDGTYVGSPDLTAPSPMPSSDETACALNGTDQAVDTGYTDHVGDTFSVEITLRTPSDLSSLPHNMRLATKDRVGAAGSFILRIHDDGRWATKVVSSGFQSGAQDMDISVTPEPDTNYHVVMVYDDPHDRYELWVNGEMVGSRGSRGPVDSTDLPIVLGSDSVLGDRWLEGVLAEAAIYIGTALSPERIEAHYAAWA